MAPSQSQGKALYPQSFSEHTLSQVTLEALLTSNGKAEENRLRMAQGEPDHDPLAPARGIVNGLRLSVTLWSLIALVVLLMR